VRALIGSHELGAVATLTTRRTVQRLLDSRGRALAELADDTVTGVRLDADLPDARWREVEIELVEGDRELMEALAATMRAAGVSPAGSSSKAGRVLAGPSTDPTAKPGGRKAPAGEVLDGGLRDAAHALLTADPLLRLDRPAAPERMRTAVQQLRAALALRHQVATEERSEALRAELAWVDTTVASLDDADRTHQRIRAALALESKDLVLGPVSRRTERELAATRKAALAAVRAMLDSDRYLGVMQTVRGMTGSIPLPPVDGRAADVLPELANRAASRAQRRLGQLRRAQSDGERRWQLAGARRAVERARYAELLVPGRKVSSLSTVLTKAADVLAEMDLSLQTQTALRALGVQAQLAGESAFTFGRLHGLEDLHRIELDRELKAVRSDLKRAQRH
jgi:inorganic triphosphatase YgiF